MFEKLIHLRKNKVYFYIELILVAFFMWLLIDRIIFDIQWDHSYTGYGINDWLINYQGGFVRRGLIGEFLYQIYQLYPFNIKSAIIIFDVLAFGMFFILSLRAFFKQKWSILPLLFPLVCVGSGIVNYRRDFFILLIVYGIYALYIRFYSHRKIILGLVLEVLMVLSILIYEPTFFLFVPLLGIITLCNIQGTTSYKLFYTLGLFAAPTITMGFVCLWKGDPNQAQIIWDSWQPLFEKYPEKDMIPEEIGCGIEFLGHGLKETMSFHLNLLFGYKHFFAIKTIVSNILMFVSYPMIYFLVTRVPSVSIKEREISQNTHSLRLSSIFIIQLLAMSPMLTFLSCDLGRTIPYCMYTTFFLIYYFDKNRISIHLPNILHNISNRVQQLIDKNRILSSYPLYLFVFFLTPLRFCYAPKVRDNLAYKTIWKIFH